MSKEPRQRPNSRRQHGQSPAAAPLHAAPDTGYRSHQSIMPRLPVLASPANLLGLQRQIGNQAIQRLLRPHVQRRSAGHTPGVGAAPVIQRYTEMQLGGIPWRLADTGTILVREETASDLPNRTHFLWAHPTLIQDANSKLDTAQSFIRLYDAGQPKTVKVRGNKATLEEEILIRADQLGKTNPHDPVANYYKAQDLLLGGPEGGQDQAIPITRVLPEFVGPGTKAHAQQQKTPEPQTPGVYGYQEGSEAPRSDALQTVNPIGTKGTGLTLPSDCNKAARVIMGVLDDPVQGAPSPTQAEAPVTLQGQQEVEHRRKDTYNLSQIRTREDSTAGPSSLLESGSLTALSSALVKYGEVLATRPIFKLYEQQIDAFFQRKEIGILFQNLNQATNDKAWIAFSHLRDLLLDGKPLLYEDFVAWSGMDAKATPQVGEALVTYRLETNQGGKRTVNKKAYIKMVAALAQQIESQGPNFEKEIYESYDQAEDEVKKGFISLEKLKGELVHPSTKDYMKPIKQSQIMEKEKTIELNQAVVELIQGLRSTGVKSPEDWKNLAILALKSLEITDQTNMIDVSRHLSGSRVALSVFQKLNPVLEKEGLWNKHWAGIVMTEGGDYVSLENDASTDTDEKRGKLNTRWGFMLYGSAKQGQSFHEQMLAKGEGDFGTFASTVRHRRPTEMK